MMGFAKLCQAFAVAVITTIAAIGCYRTTSKDQQLQENDREISEVFLNTRDIKDVVPI